MPSGGDRGRWLRRWPPGGTACWRDLVAWSGPREDRGDGAAHSPIRCGLRRHRGDRPARHGGPRHLPERPAVGPERPGALPGRPALPRWSAATVRRPLSSSLPTSELGPPRLAITGPPPTGEQAMPISPLDEFLVHQIPEPIDHCLQRQPALLRPLLLQPPLEQRSAVPCRRPRPVPKPRRDGRVRVDFLRRHPAHRPGVASARLKPPRHRGRADPGQRPRGSPIAAVGLRAQRMGCGVRRHLRREPCAPSRSRRPSLGSATAITQETFRFAQVGTWTGTLEVAGRRFDVTPDAWQGARDHSWGIRQVGKPPPVDPRQQANAPRGGSFTTGCRYSSPTTW